MEEKKTERKPIKSERLEERRKSISQEVKDKVDAEYNAAKSLQEVLGIHNAWPLVGVLKKLTGAAKYLLDVKNYDRHGWEEVSHCVKRGEEIISLLETTPVYASQPSEQWIKVSDRLPEVNCRKYLVWDVNSPIPLRHTISRLNSHNKWFNEDGDEIHPTHWIPLPQKPKE